MKITLRYGHVAAAACSLLLPAVLGACSATAGDATRSSSGAETVAVSGPKVGVLFSSYGDIDSPDEAEGYVKRSVEDPDVSPIPVFLKPFIANVGWLVVGNNTKKEYEQIGGSTHYRANSEAQANAVADVLRSQGIDATGYTGFVFTYPYIADTMAKMQADGIEEVIVFDQGAQYSKATQYINVREVNKYLAVHTEWNAKVTAVRSFSDDIRFKTLVGDSIQRRLDSDFAGVPADQMCIFVPNHGLPTYLPDSGDPAIAQMLANVDYLKQRFSDYYVTTAFQNHDEFPGSKWTQPRDKETAQGIGENPRCQNVLISGRISFTIDNLETMFDEAIFQKGEILKKNPSAKVVADTMFNSEPDFVNYMATVTVEARQGIGDLQTLR